MGPVAQFYTKTGRCPALKSKFSLLPDRAPLAKAAKSRDLRLTSQPPRAIHISLRKMSVSCSPIFTSTLPLVLPLPAPVCPSLFPIYPTPRPSQIRDAVFQRNILPGVPTIFLREPGKGFRSPECRSAWHQVAVLSQLARLLKVSPGMTSVPLRMARRDLLVRSVAPRWIIQPHFSLGTTIAHR